MSIRMISGCAMAVLILVAGCSREHRIPFPTVDPAAAAAKAMEMYDANHDGKLDNKELNACPPIKYAVRQIDKTGDGITAEKIAERIKAWRKARNGRMGVDCIVLRNRKPLAGAEVKFVPESFLGDSYQTASGKTDGSGMASISVPTAGPDEKKGVAPGFYRVEITKAGEKIPPQYNTKTTLCCEVAIDAEGAGRGLLRFNLKY